MYVTFKKKSENHNTSRAKPETPPWLTLLSKSLTYLLQNFWVLSQYNEFLMTRDWPFLLRTPRRLCPWKHGPSVPFSVQLN